MRWMVWRLALLCASLVPCAWTQAGSPAPAPDMPVSVQLGNSAVPLQGPWRFHVGDDPRWASPGMDDRAWEQVSLASPGDAEADSSDLLPGWTALGHPGYTGFAWYRLLVKVGGAHGPLALKMPDAVDDAYEVFVNGKLAGRYGHFTPHGVRAYAATPQAFALPAGMGDGEFLVAIRVWMDSATRFITPDAGGLRAAPVLGARLTIAGQVRLDWDDQAHLVGSSFLESLVLLLAFAVALAHFALMRLDKAYLWLALAVLVTLLGNAVLQIVNFTTWIPQTEAILLRDVVLAPLRIALWVVFWASWFGLATARRLWWVLGGLTLLLAAGTAMLRPPLHGELVSLSVGHWVSPLLVWIKLAIAGVLLWVLVRAMQRNRAEGLMALPAVLLGMAANYQRELHLLHIPVTFSVLRFDVSLGEVSTMLSLVIVTLMGSWRFLLAQRHKVQWELEVRQARELQQVIVPHELPRVPGLHIESDYRPSREVGGDFFRILPNREDGSVLVLVGDVTGKGLQAGMLVALIVGAVDTAAKEHPDPEALLALLNEGLCERGFATATCLVMKIGADGYVTLANAGHLPPYLNGRELAMEGALPLGTLPGLDYTRTELRLEVGDRLVLLTDGVVEASDEHGELLGFERIGAMIAARASVRAVADAAAQHGQEDDILVLALERVPPVPAAAQAA